MVFNAGAMVLLLVILGLGWRLAASGGSSNVQRLRQKLDAAPSPPLARARGGLVRSERLSDIPLLQHWLAQWGRGRRLQSWLAQAGLAIRPGKFLLAAVAAAALSGLAVSCFAPWFGSLPAALLAGWLPWMWVARRRRRRLDAFQAQLPDALDLFVRASRAGHPPAAILELVAAEMPAPLAGEFRQVWEEQRFGLPLRDCWLHLGERVPLVDVQFLATAMLVQRESGGNLSEILEKLACVMRDRVRVKREMRTHSAQGRMTMWVLAALAPLLLLLLDAVSPQFTQAMFTDPLGRSLLGVGAALQILGLLLLQRVVDIKV